MALNYRDRYPGQTVDGGTSYPEGMARDVSVPGDGTGTPWQKDLLNDLWGFLQALTRAAEIEISGEIDTALVSDRLNALRKLTRRMGCQVAVSGTSIADDANCTLELTRQTATLEGDAEFVILDSEAEETDGEGIAVKVPEAGLYLVTFCGSGFVNSSSNPGIAKLNIHASQHLDIYAYRYNTDTLGAMSLGGSFLCHLNNIDEFLFVKNESGDEFSLGTGTLTITRVSGGVDGW